MIDILPAILFGDHTRKVQYINQPFVPGADGTKILFSESLFPRYFYYLVAFAVSHMDSRGYGRHFALLKKAEIPVALLKSHQVAIANYLDKAFALLEKIKKKQEELQHMALVLKKAVLSAVFSSDKSYYGPLHQTTLGELIPHNKVGDGDWVLSEDMDENGDYRLVQLKHIGFGEYINKPYQRVNKRFFVDKKCSEIKEGYLLINRLVAGKMYVCLLPRLPFKTITSVDVCWIKPDQNYIQDYLMYYLMSPQFQESVLLSSSGSTRKRISKTALLQIEILIHKKQQQELIVRSIKDIFALLESVFD